MTALSVVVCTRGRGALIPPLIDAVLAQLPERSEVWVLDQSDPDEAAALERELVAAAPDVHHVRLPVEGLPAARNAALARCRGRVVLFLDDDVALGRGCLGVHLRAYRDPAVGGVVGRIVERSHRPNAAPGTNRIGWDGRIRTNLESGAAGPIDSLKGANMSVRRRAAIAVGGFDEELGGTALLEDAELSLRLRAHGWTLRFEPAAEVHHRSAPTGGVRVADAVQTERWRLENTALVVRRARGRRGMWLAAPALATLAVARGVRWRAPTASWTLLAAVARGWRRGAASSR